MEVIGDDESDYEVDFSNQPIGNWYLVFSVQSFNNLHHKMNNGSLVQSHQVLCHLLAFTLSNTLSISIYYYPFNMSLSRIIQKNDPQRSNSGFFSHCTLSVILWSLIVYIIILPFPAGTQVTNEQQDPEDVSGSIKGQVAQQVTSYVSTKCPLLI